MQGRDQGGQEQGAPRQWFERLAASRLKKDEVALTVTGSSWGSGGGRVPRNVAHALLYSQRGASTMASGRCSRLSTEFGLPRFMSPLSAGHSRPCSRRASDGAEVQDGSWSDWTIRVPVSCLHVDEMWECAVKLLASLGSPRCGALSLLLSFSSASALAGGSILYYLSVSCRLYRPNATRSRQFHVYSHGLYHIAARSKK